MKQIILGFLLLLFFSCKDQKATEKQVQLFLEFVQETQLIQEYLLEKTKEPSFEEIKKKLEQIQKESVGSPFSPIYNSVSTLLKEKPDSEEKWSKLHSEMAEILYPGLKLTQNAKYHKFHCPMVDRSWIDAGVEVRNPHSKSMRDCGEMID